MSTTDPPSNADESASSPPAAPHPGIEAAPSVGQEARLEKVRKVYVRDLEERERVHTVFLVTRKARNVGRSGKTYLSLVLADRTGDIDARIFDGVEQLESAFAVGDYVLVQGEVIAFHGKRQVLIHDLERLDPEPIDRKEFAAAAQPLGEASRSVAQIRELVSRVHDPHVKSLLSAFFEDPQVADGLQRAPAAKGIHHSYPGGLAEHILSVIKLAHRIADHYPMVDRDLLVAGAMLHDIGKVSELSYEKGVDYTDEGRLVGHQVMTAQKIREKTAQISNFPKLLEHHITHLVLSHQGSTEHGSPKVPMTLEALLLHSIDLIDTQVSSWLELMSRDHNEKWTEVSKLYERSLWKGNIPTVRNKAPVEAKARRRNGAERRKSAAAAPVPASPELKRHAAKHDDRGETTLPKDLTFKPLSELATEPSTAPDDEGASSGSAE